MPSTRGSMTTTAPLGGGGGAAAKTAWAALATASSNGRTGGGGGGAAGAAGAALAGCCGAEALGGAACVCCGGAEGCDCVAVACCGAVVVGSPTADVAGADCFTSVWVELAGGCLAAHPASETCKAKKKSKPHKNLSATVEVISVFFITRISSLLRKPTPFGGDDLHLPYRSCCVTILHSPKTLLERK